MAKRMTAFEQWVRQQRFCHPRNRRLALRLSKGRTLVGAWKASLNYVSARRLADSLRKECVYALFHEGALTAHELYDWQGLPYEWDGEFIPVLRQITFVDVEDE